MGVRGSKNEFWRKVATVFFSLCANVGSKVKVDTLGHSGSEVVFVKGEKWREVE